LKSLKTKSDKLKSYFGYKTFKHEGMNRIHNEPYKYYLSSSKLPTGAGSLFKTLFSISIDDYGDGSG